jgi:isopenicillin-N epimerase
VTNATVGLNIVARSLDLHPGDEVLSTDHEYGALDRTWRFLCAKRGAKYIRQPVPVPIASAADVVEAVWSGVTEQTRVLFISHITSPTAIIFPIKPLIDRARERGIVTIVDGAHAPGQIDLNLRELGADYYSGNLHKWLMSPKGSAFLYVRKEMQHLVEPLVVSWGWEAEKPGATSRNGRARATSPHFSASRRPFNFSAIMTGRECGTNATNWCGTRDNR